MLLHISLRHAERGQRRQKQARAMMKFHFRALDALTLHFSRAMRVTAY